RLSNLETIQDSTNEATCCVFITSILNASIAITQKLTNNEKIYITYQDDVSGEDSSGRVDYSIKGYEDLICIAEGKPRNVEIGYLQLESASHMNKRKRTADQAFQNEEDYLYGIVSTGIAELISPIKILYIFYLRLIIFFSSYGMAFY